MRVFTLCVERGWERKNHARAHTNSSRTDIGTGRQPRAYTYKHIKKHTYTTTQRDKDESTLGRPDEHARVYTYIKRKDDYFFQNYILSEKNNVRSTERYM